MKKKKHPITVADGDGIGPEIMKATLDILEAAEAPLDIEKVTIGEKLYLSGHPTGIEDSAWESLRRTKVFLKAPITTPQGGGYRSLNVTIRGKLGLYANVRPCVSYSPFIETKHPKMDVVIIRENEEDLYTGIEYRHTPEVYGATKLITRPGCEKIVRYAFEFATHFKRKKVTCFTKDNILKLTDGLFHKVFDEIGEEYPDIEKEHWIIDIGAAKLANTPEKFDVLVLPNLYGDILSDVAAEISGSVGLAGSSNIGEHGAMFEAIHGSAPKRAGQNIANPSGLILASVMMMLHLHEPVIAAKIHNAWLRTIEEGIHTYDIFKEGVSRVLVGTHEFAQAVINQLGQHPIRFKAVAYEGKRHEFPSHKGTSLASTKRELAGIDVYVYSHDSVEKLSEKLKLAEGKLKLTKIYNRGVQVYPDGLKETSCVDEWRCRFLSQTPLTTKETAALLQTLADHHLDVTRTDHLYRYDGAPGYSS